LSEGQALPLLLTLGIFRSVWDGLVPVAGRVVIVTTTVPLVNSAGPNNAVS
jgi:hypothetical protein